MSDASTTSTTPLMLKELGPTKLQTTVPSVIKKRASVDGESTTKASTLRGTQNKKPTTPESNGLPNGWTRMKHPDSGVYYVHKEKKLSTSCDVLNSRILTLITEGANALHASPALQELLKDQKDIVLVLDVKVGNGPTKTSYYCVSHVERCIFWLEGIGHEEVDIPCTSNKCTRSKVSRTHCIEAQYWKHCELFPTTFTVTKEVTGNLKDILLQAAADRLMVKFSTSPYDKNDLEYMLKMVKEIEVGGQEGGGYSGWIIARFMALYNDGVLQSSYGQSDDYFDIEDTGPPIGPYKRPPLLAILAPFVFKSPDVYAAELHSFHENFTPQRWSNFVHKVDQSIRDSNLLATVLMNTNAGLLSWTENGKMTGINSPLAEQIVSYISIICSVGSIIIGLFIFKQYRSKGADTPLRAVVLLKRILKKPYGLESLAIVCSLPYVLLMWGLVAFLTAFGIVFYRNTGIEVRLPVTLALFFVILGLFFCLYTAGPPEKEEELARKAQSLREESFSNA